MKKKNNKQNIKEEQKTEEIKEEIIQADNKTLDETEALKEELEQIKEELKIAKEDYIKTHADFENIKKRLEKEKYQAIDYASEKFAKDLLTPLDTLQMALQSANGDDESKELLQKIKDGIELTLKSFVTIFEKNNIEIVDTNCEFDPQIHEAIMQVDSNEHEYGQIVEVMQKGYMFKDRLLRPAMVSICKK